MNLRQAIKNKIYGKRQLQRLFEKLYTISLGGLNYGNFDFATNGEEYILKNIKKKTKDKKRITLFDIGANNGSYLSLINNIFDKRVFVHSFEPSKVAFDKLCSKDYSNIKCVKNNFGLGNSNTNADLYYTIDGDSGSSIFNFSYSKDNQYKGTEKIQITTINSYCKDKDINYIDFLKIDAEGSEFMILQGADQLLCEKKIGLIQFEFGDKMMFSKTSFLDFYSFFNKHDYTIYRLLKNGFIPFRNYSANNEIYAGTNYLAMPNS